MTECNRQGLLFQDLGRRTVVADFDGGTISSDAGALILREIDVARDFTSGFSSCFIDYRDQRYVEHSVRELVAQRVMGICLGYEDLIDHETLRADPLFAAVCGKLDPSGMGRKVERDRGRALAGKSTLNRLELHPRHILDVDKYHRIQVNGRKVNEFFVDAFLDSYRKAPKRIVLDLDATDDPLHGQQEGRFFHGYYDCYCYLPLYIFCGSHPLCAKLRPSNIDASAGAVEEVERIVEQIRMRWPKVKIVLRADSGFCREELMSWCEANRVGYVIGMARNARLIARIRPAMKKAIRGYLRTGKPARVYKHFRYRTLDTWSRSRHVIGKAEYLEKGENPRFVVFYLPDERPSIQEIYEEEYCARGDMENRIKEQQLYLFADRTSSKTLRANQLRLWFSTVAYIIMNELRIRALAGTELERAGCETIRLKLLKIGARVRVSVRRIHVSMASGYPYQRLLCRILENLAEAYPLRI
jgi:hypothetical protein